MGRKRGKLAMKEKKGGRKRTREGKRRDTDKEELKRGRVIENYECLIP